MWSRFSCVRLFATPWTVGCPAPLSMGFPRQEYWSGLPCPPPGNLLHPGIEPMSPEAPALQAESILLSHWWSPVYRISWGNLMGERGEKSRDSEYGLGIYWFLRCWCEIQKPYTVIFVFLFLDYKNRYKLNYLCNIIFLLISIHCILKSIHHSPKIYFVKVIN